MSSRSDYAEQIGRAIFKLRTKKGWSRIELSNLSGVDEIQISLIEEGKMDPTLGAIQVLANSLSTSVNGILSASRTSLRHKDQELTEFVGEAVKIRRKKLGLSRTALAKRIDVLPQYISTIENKKRLPLLANLEKIAEGLETSILFFCPDEPFPDQQIIPIKELAERIRAIRTSNSLSIEEFSRHVGVSTVHILSLEKNKGNPKLQTILQICEGMGLSASEALSIGFGK